MNLMMLAIAVSVLVLGAAAAAAAAAAAVTTAETEVSSADQRSALDNINVNVNVAASSASSLLQQTTSSLMGGARAAAGIGSIGEQMLPIRQQIRNQLDALSESMSMSTSMSTMQMDAWQYDKYLREALNSASSAVWSSFSPQQLQLINDVVSMTGASYAYDAAQREMDIHRECIAAAYRDLSSAAQIAVGIGDGDGDGDGRLAQLKNHVLSAVKHLQDSCPLCRALKYAANDANQNFLPFVTVLCSSVLRTLHPFVAES